MQSMLSMLDFQDYAGTDVFIVSIIIIIIIII